MPFRQLTHRTQMEMRIDVLRICSNPLFISEICTKVRLSNNQAIDILNKLGSFGMIEPKKQGEVNRIDRRSIRKDGVLFVCTNKGSKTLHEYDALLARLNNSAVFPPKVGLKLIFDTIESTACSTHIGKIAEQVGRSTAITRETLQYLSSLTLVSLVEVSGQKSFFASTELGRSLLIEYQNFENRFAPVQSFEYLKIIRRIQKRN